MELLRHSNMKKLLTPIALSYLRFFARRKLSKMHPVVIGIGGASGKSSVSQMIAGILSQKYLVLESLGKNSETGIPLTILGFSAKNYSIGNWLRIFLKASFVRRKKFDYFVCEMGIDGPKPPKNMEYLLRIVKPDIAILTNIDIEHSVYFDDLVKTSDPIQRKKEILEFLASEEGLLLGGVKIGGRVIINLDDKNIVKAVPQKSLTTTISLKSKKADFFVSKIDVGLEKFEMEFIFLNERYRLTLARTLPKFYGYSLMFSIAAAFACGIGASDSIKYLEKNFELPPGRFSVFPGLKNSIIFDSSYNSSLSPAKGAIELLSQLKSGRRKVGILGDMRELGSLAKIQHQELSRVILKNLDFAILIGPNMKEFVIPILAGEHFPFVFFDSFKDARDKITGLIKEKDLILVKGSQNTLFLERAVELLLENKNDAEKLCRRGEFWKKGYN